MTTRVTLAGSTGVLGRAIALEARARGIDVVTWDPREAPDVPPGGPVVAAVPESEVGPLLATCLAAGVDVVAACADGAVVADLTRRYDEPARAAGRSVVLSAGWDPLVADLLAARATVDLPEPVEAHVAYATPRAGLRHRTPGERRRVADALGRPFPALVDGRSRLEREAESRRLAWFPRPVGPRHAAGTSSAVVSTLPPHVPSVRTVRGYRATSTSAAETRQLVHNAARVGVVRDLLARLLTRGGPRGDAGHPALGWACVVELTDGAVVSRAWAHGDDHVALSAASVLMVAEAVALGGRAPGLRAPAEVLDPGASLDDLAARSRLRWGRAASDRVGG